MAVVIVAIVAAKGCAVAACSFTGHAGQGVGEFRPREDGVVELSGELSEFGRGWVRGHRG